MANSLVYIVYEELEGGYLPDSTSYFATAELARSEMRDRAKEARNDGWRVRGSARNGRYALRHPETSDHALDHLILLDARRRLDFEREYAGLSISELVERLNEEAS